MSTDHTKRAKKKKKSWATTNTFRAVCEVCMKGCCSDNRGTQLCGDDLCTNECHTDCLPQTDHAYHSKWFCRCCAITKDWPTRPIRCAVGDSHSVEQNEVPTSTPDAVMVNTRHGQARAQLDYRYLASLITIGLPIVVPPTPKSALPEVGTDETAATGSSMPMPALLSLDLHC